MKQLTKGLTGALAYLAIGFLWLLSLLPLRIHYILSDGMYLIVYRLIGYRLKVVRKNLSGAFPEKSAEELQQIERDFYHWFCDYLVETFKMMTISEKEMRRRMVFNNTELLNNFIAEGRSCALLLGHYCNWEWITALPMSVSHNPTCAELYHPIENPQFNQMFLNLRQRFGRRG